MKTTLQNILKHSSHTHGLTKLLKTLGKTKADDEPLSIRTILDSNGLDYALWSLRAVEGDARIIRLYAVWCAKQVEHLMKNEISKKTIVVAERHANGAATDNELNEALQASITASKDIASDAANATAMYLASDAAMRASSAAAQAVAFDAACSTDRDTNCATSWEAARDAESVAARAAAMEADSVTEMDAARDVSIKAVRAANWDAARASALTAARTSQENELRRVLDCIDAGNDPYPR